MTGLARAAGALGLPPTEPGALRAALEAVPISGLTAMRVRVPVRRPFATATGMWLHREAWLVLTQLADALGASVGHSDVAAIRAAIAVALAGVGSYAGITQVSFAKPQSARTWLNASNPSERWKWDHMFQDLPPVKGDPQIFRAELVKK